MKDFDYQDVVWWQVANNHPEAMLVLGLLVLGVVAVLTANRK
jgi:hypothetical protein|tara:strand:+ start:96128 stop:96253 length:126 start_codon:yes stop_codon:yes gene_type:complete